MAGRNARGATFPGSSSRLTGLRCFCYLVNMLVTRSGIARELEELGLRSGGVVMVHCRLSALGHVVGGAETVVRALLDAVGSGGTLVAYTGWQDAPPDDLDVLDEEARRACLDEHPAYDPRIALSRRDHGRVPEALRTWPGALRSGHPEAGVVAVGHLAGEITASHPHDDAYGAGTPYARLVELGGQVAMLDAPLDTVTLVHHAEAVAQVPKSAASSTVARSSKVTSASGGASRTSTPLRGRYPTSAS
jgi:aminoglycoside 3-N-acetyltransferase